MNMNSTLSNFTVTASNNSTTNSNYAKVDYHYWTLILGVFLLATLFGNILVILSVVRTPSLKSVTNYIIVSLAVADILVAVLVMPLAIYVEVTDGSFMLHPYICDAWISADVLSCTASIINLTAISIDRYISVVYPLEYTHRFKNNTKYPVLAISISWCISFTITFPIMVGANHTQHKKSNSCSFSNPLYTILSSVGSFYIPTAVMLMLYWKVFGVIRVRAKALRVKNISRERALNNNQKRLPEDSSASDNSRSKDGGENSDLASHRNHQQQSSKQNTDMTNEELIPLTAEVKQDSEGVTNTSDNNTIANGANDAASEPTSLDPTCPMIKNGNKNNISSGSKINSKSSYMKSPSKQKKDRNEKRERKATITVVVVLGVFLLCWIPFFMMNNIGAICQLRPMENSICNPHPKFYSVFVWLGYINSTLNPLIYALFNNEYRKAFRKLLHRD